MNQDILDPAGEHKTNISYVQLNLVQTQGQLYQPSSQASNQPIGSLQNDILEQQLECEKGITDSRVLVLTQIEKFQQEVKVLITQSEELVEQSIKKYEEANLSDIAESQNQLQQLIQNPNIPEPQISQKQNNIQKKTKKGQLSYKQNRNIQKKKKKIEASVNANRESKLLHAQQEGRRKLTELQDQLRIQINKEYDEFKKNTTESQIQLATQAKQQQEINQQQVTQTLDFLQEEIQKTQIESRRRITQSQNTLKAYILQCQTECAQNQLQSKPLLEAQVKQCKNVCNTNNNEVKTLLGQITQLNKKERNKIINQTQDMMLKLIQLIYLESKQHIEETQILLIRLIPQCQEEYRRNIKEQQLLLQTSIQEHKIGNENILQLQTSLHTQLQQCQRESQTIITKQQKQILDNMQQYCVENEKQLMELQNLLEAQIKQCHDEIIIKSTSEVEAINQRCQVEDDNQIFNSQILLDQEIKKNKPRKNTFTEQAIVFQAQIKPQAQHVSPQIFKEEQIKLEAEQPHMVLTKSEHFSDKNQLAALTSKLNDQIEDYIQDLKLNNQIEDPAKYSVPQRIDADNPEVLFHVLKESFQRQNKTLLASKKSSKLNLIGLQGLFAGGTENSSESKVTLQETPNLTFDLINSNQNLEKQFKEDFASSLAKDLNVNQDQVKILRIERGSIKVIYEVIDNAGGTHSGSNLQELEKKFPGTKPALKIHEYFQQACLNINDFDPRYNMHWTSEGSAPRGPTNNSLTYYFPNGWKGYALKVTGIYGANDNWLAMNQNPDEWYVLFHGTHQQFVKQIMNQRLVGGLLNKPDSRQAWNSSKCLRTGEPVGRGVYFSNHVEVCEDVRRGYSSVISIGTKQFKVVFQSRVCPINLRQVKKDGDIQGKPNQAEWDNDYFVVNQSCDIRPYRILLKDITKN